MTDLDARFDLAVQLALEGGALAARMRAALPGIETKSALDFCTAADRDVERLIRARVGAQFGDAVIGEEEGGAAHGECVWIVDPIDGTAGYIHGTGRWCVSIACLCGDAVELGVIYAPASDALFTARRGGGAFLNGRPVRTSALAHGAAPVAELGWSQRRPIERYCALLQTLTEAGIEFRRHGSGALGLADVARGVSDGYAELHINAWDVAAGLLIVTEAGGRTNGFFTADALRLGNPVVAATAEFYDRLAAAVLALA